MAKHRTSEQWRVPDASQLDLEELDTRTTAGAPGGKSATRAASEELRTQLVELQHRLYAESRRSLLLVLQAMDTGGKDGTIRKVFSGVNPQGVRVHSFKAPTEAERAHDFLWRVHPQVPAHGEIAIFNRSHYEDVLVARVHELVGEPVWQRRYAQIRAFEATLADAGTQVVKVFLHISADEQRERLQARLDTPDKRWKFDVGDLAERRLWPDYQRAYRDAIAETSTAAAPWYVVGADRKWYRDWAVLTLLVETLQAMDPRYPPPAADLEGLTVD